MRSPQALARRLRWLFGASLIISAVPLSVQASGIQHTTRHPSVKHAALAHIRYIYRGLQVTPPHKRWQRGKLKQALYSAYGVRTGKRQRASLGFIDGTLLHINSSTQAMLRSGHVTNVKQGEIYQSLIPGTNHTIQTASAIGAATGTQFDLKIKGKREVFIVVEGALRVRNRYGSVVVKNNHETVVMPGRAPTHPVHVDATRATSWVNTIPPPDTALPEDIALDANGGHVVGYSSQTGAPGGGAGWDARYINDGRLDRGWGTATGNVSNQWVTIGFRDAQTFMIDSVVIDPAANRGPSPASDVKDFAIQTSTTGTAAADFTTVLTATAKPKNALQRYILPSPVAAKYIRLVTLSNYGDPRTVEVAELEVVGGPQPIAQTQSTAPAPAAPETVVSPTSDPTATATPTATPTATSSAPLQLEPATEPPAPVAPPISQPATPAPYVAPVNVPHAPRPTDTAIPATPTPLVPTECPGNGVDKDAWSHSANFGPRNPKHPDHCAKHP